MMATEIDVCRAFLAALMLTGRTEAAEGAVSDAIAKSECEVNELLIDTARCANQLCNECLPGPEISFSLPPELQRLFLLSSVGRKCFVLRILMGLTLEVTSEILNLRTDEVDDALCRALSDLPGLAGIRLRGYNEAVLPEAASPQDLTTYKTQLIGDRKERIRWPETKDHTTQL